MSPSVTSCPACAQALDPVAALERCPACGAALQPQTGRITGGKFAGLVLAVLLMPLVALLFPDGAPVAALLLAPAAALVAGILLGVRLGRSPGAKIGLSLLMIPICLVAIETLLGIGCSLIDYRIRFQ